MREFGISQEWERAYAVFSPRADLWWLRLLKPGFRHCFVVLCNGERLVAVEPLASRIEICSIDAPLGPDAFLESLEALGMKVVRAGISRAQDKGWRFGIFTCVEVVKRILGVEAWLAITPYRLYRRLSKPARRNP
jgi:hypothetical protein